MIKSEKITTNSCAASIREWNVLQLGPIKIINTRLFGTPSPLPLAKQDSKVGALVKYFLSVVIDHVSSSSSHAAPSSASLSAAHDSLNSAQCRRMKILILDGELPPHWAMATAHIGSKVSRRFVSGQLLLPHCHLPSCCCLACFTVKMTHPG